MIKQSISIDERKLVNIMEREGMNVVNIGEDSFQYCNGYMVAICDYDMDIVIQKLFNIGALTNYKNWTPKRTQDLTTAIDLSKEVDAEKTEFLHSYYCGARMAYVFKIGDKYFYYDKRYVDVFKDATFKGVFDEDGDIPALKIYNQNKFIGLILAVISPESTKTLLSILGK